MALGLLQLAGGEARPPDPNDRSQENQETSKVCKRAGTAELCPNEVGLRPSDTPDLSCAEQIGYAWRAVGR